MAGYKTPPNPAYGALFAGPPGSTRIYSFGGTSSGYNTTFQNYFLPPDTTYGLWFYDFDTTVWTAIDTLAQGITIPSHGASTEAVDQGLGFYLGGQLDNGTSNDTSSLEYPVAIPGMIVVDTNTGRVANFTVPDFAASNRQDGAAIYIPEFGEKGVVIALGGMSKGRLLDMSQIAVFDVSTLNYTARSSNTATMNTWYTVQASGEVPNSRGKFCMVAVSAEDHSSTNIYMYGGQSESSVFDDVFVLSLPSFTWTRVFSGTAPRSGMACFFVAPRNMIISGGIGPTNNLTADCDWLNQGIGFLDLTEVRAGSGWSPDFNAYAEPYKVPAAVLDRIGGGDTGRAAQTGPSAGWADPALAELFSLRVTQVVNGTNAITPAQTSFWTGLNTAARSGIIVGSVLALAFLSILALFLFKYRQKRLRNAGARFPEDSMTPELQAPAEPQEVHGVDKKIIRTEKDGVVVYEAPVIGVYEVADDADTASHVLYEVPHFEEETAGIAVSRDGNRFIPLAKTNVEASLQPQELQ